VIEYEAYGQARQVELLPGGADLAVTTSNRVQFVELYCNWLLNASVADQFAAFASGFHRVCGGPALSLFRWVGCWWLCSQCCCMGVCQCQSAGELGLSLLLLHNAVGVTSGT
jgi:hypothetical protein